MLTWANLKREIGKALSPLSNLRTLYLHLDFKDAPHPYAMHNESGKEEFAQLRRTLQSAANVLAQELGSSAETVCILQRRMSNNTWLPFLIARTDDAVYARPEEGRANELGVR